MNTAKISLTTRADWRLYILLFFLFFLHKNAVSQENSSDFLHFTLQQYVISLPVMEPIVDSVIVGQLTCAVFPCAYTL